MRSIDAILKNTGNRTYSLPVEPWKYYQEWNDVIFMHWKVPANEVAQMLPPALAVDTVAGDAYISWVAFTVSDLSFGSIPLPPYFSSFKEINLRTYVVKDNIPGIYMFSLETNKWAVALLTRLMLGIPYKTSKIYRTGRKFESHNSALGFNSEFDFKPGDEIAIKDTLDYWLTERHCLYQDVASKLFRFDIHHREWKFQTLKITIKELDYRYKAFDTDEKLPVRLHFARNIKVLLWGRKEV